MDTTGIEPSVRSKDASVLIGFTHYLYDSGLCVESAQLLLVEKCS